MKSKSKDYFKTLASLLGAVELTGAGGMAADFHQGMAEAIGLILERAAAGGQLIFIGNGGSAAIAGHMAVDFWKTAGIKSLAFTDSSLLTCISNDYGYRHVFEKPIEMFARPGDVLLAISSSGRSENILRGVGAARKTGAAVVTFSGFKPDNPLRGMGDYNFYVPSGSYGYVEIVHQAIVHALLDLIMTVENGRP